MLDWSLWRCAINGFGAGFIIAGTLLPNIYLGAAIAGKELSGNALMVQPLCFCVGMLLLLCAPLADRREQSDG